jgi:hypothetical protein
MRGESGLKIVAAEEGCDDAFDAGNSPMKRISRLASKRARNLFA